MKQTYDGYSHTNWMNGLGELDEYNKRHLLAMFGMFGIPESYMDVGCGTGAMVRVAKQLGVRAYGLDQLVDETWGPDFFHVNLVNAFSLPDDPVDIVTSFEVGEHLHESAHATYCDTLCRNLKQGADHHLVFSAARPGQGGTGHIACRPAEYWHNEFLLRGLHYNAHLTMTLGLIWSKIGTPLNYLVDNLIVFSR